MTYENEDWERIKQAAGVDPKRMSRKQMQQRISKYMRRDPHHPERSRRLSSRQEGAIRDKTAETLRVARFDRVRMDKDGLAVLNPKTGEFVREGVDLVVSKSPRSGWRGAAVLRDSRGRIQAWVPLEYHGRLLVGGPSKGRRGVRVR